MSLMQKTKATLITILFWLAVGMMPQFPGFACAQMRNNAVMPRNTTPTSWRVFSPPNKSFTVELPGKPRHAKKLDPTSSDENEKAFFACTRSIDAYILSPHSDPLSNTFVIGDFDVSGCLRKPEQFEVEVNRIIAIIGGDNKRIVRDALVLVDGLSGREVYFESGERFGRLLFVNTSKRIYMLVFQSAAAEATASPEVTRMFSSFRPSNN